MQLAPFKKLSPFSLWDEFVSQENFVPSADIIEDRNQVEIRVNVPEYRPEDITVDVEGRLLTIRGTTEQREEEKDKHYIRRERSYGEFERCFTLPDYVDIDKIDCTVENGTLSIIAPKREGASNGRKKIEVRSKR
ncbi:heat-shock protein [Candidatus Peregrinibacteria bacterium CG11_big_fil_rev_8_21_14_0_20_46_8]|nr:MAG: heat-shock protein [Candidatus Peregrinibacteria bacterium CG11_big_fil_rev_8_21_14_0_20_46_8]